MEEELKQRTRTLGEIKRKLSTLRNTVQWRLNRGTDIRVNHEIHPVKEYSLATAAASKGLTIFLFGPNHFEFFLLNLALFIELADTNIITKHRK